MNANDILRESIQFSVELLEMMTVDMTPEQLHWNPPGTAHSVAATLAHGALETDWQIHELYEGGTPRFESDWAGKTGVSEPTPHQTLEWAQNVRLDRAAFDKYAQAITPVLTPFSRQILKISFIMTVTIVSSGPAWPLPPGLPVSELGHFFLGGFEKS